MKRILQLIFVLFSASQSTYLLANTITFVPGTDIYFKADSIERGLSGEIEESNQSDAGYIADKESAMNRKLSMLDCEIKADARYDRFSEKYYADYSVVICGDKKIKLYGFLVGADGYTGIKNFDENQYYRFAITRKTTLALSEEAGENLNAQEDHPVVGHFTSTH